MWFILVRKLLTGNVLTWSTYLKKNYVYDAKLQSTRCNRYKQHLPVRHRNHRERTFSQQCTNTNDHCTMPLRWLIIHISPSRKQVQLKLKDNAREVKSDDAIELLITGRPKSYVALASYDQSLLQHAKNHNISRETILDKFYKQDFYTALSVFAVRAIVTICISS